MCTGDPVFGDQVATIVAKMTNQTLANEVRKQILPNVILPDSEAPVLPEPVASVVSVIDNEEIYVAAVRYLHYQLNHHPRVLINRILF